MRLLVGMVDLVARIYDRKNMVRDRRQESTLNTQTQSTNKDSLNRQNEDEKTDKFKEMTLKYYPKDLLLLNKNIRRDVI